MIAALVAGAHAAPFLQVGTGQRVLDVPSTESVFGGGVRAGWDFGRVAPFLGGTVTAGGIDVPEDNVKVSGALWSVAAGLRFDLAAPDADATPYLAAGGTIGNGAATFAYDEFDETVTVGASAGPGVFAGFGADALLMPRVALGLEIGGAWASSEVFYRYEEGGRRTEEESYDASALFGYADLHVSFLFGGGAR